MFCITVMQNMFLNKQYCKKYNTVYKDLLVNRCDLLINPCKLCCNFFVYIKCSIVYYTCNIILNGSHGKVTFYPISMNIIVYSCFKCFDCIT